MSFKPTNVQLKDGSYNNLGSVEVLDQLPGSGKTTAAFDFIKQRAQGPEEERWIFCTEYLSEIENRINQADGWHVASDDEGTKTQDFINLLREPGVRQIAITHKLLRDQIANNPEAMRLLSMKGYNLVLDEAMEGLIEPYTGIYRRDFLWNLEKGHLTIDEGRYGQVHWTDETALKFSGDTVLGPLLNDQGLVHAAVNGEQACIVKIRPDAIFRVFRRVIVMTYQFDLTLFAAYLALKQIPWQLCTDIQCGREIRKSSIGRLVHLVHSEDKPFLKKTLSSTFWTEKAKRRDYDALNKALVKIGNRFCGRNPSAFGYAVLEGCLGSKRDGKIQPKGFPHTVPHDRRKEPNRKLSCYIPCNARARNDWAHKTVMVHAINRYPSPFVAGFLDRYGVEYSPDRFALNELLQWLWRSAIRNGEPIHAAILSERMRRLFVEWREGPEATNIVPFPIPAVNVRCDRLAA
jgi:hypothetical protein